jgi:S-adenosylmethionine:tRNA ribosyltransferase-isomerase
MKTADFHYDLPEKLIAQTPIEPRDHSRLMVMGGEPFAWAHKHFYDVIDYLQPGDALVVNETKVIPARLLGQKEGTETPVEVLLLKRLSQTEWEALVKPGRRLKPGAICVFGDGRLKCEILGNVEEIGGRTVKFIYDGVFEEILDTLGQMPLPPYIHEKLSDPTRYQTVYARHEGSAAAPTAGLHFTPELLRRLEQKGVDIVKVLLHVGLGTFRPVKVEDISQHQMHSEYYEITQDAADRINRAKRVICVGTTSVRTLETVATDDGMVHPGKGETAIFITPDKKIKAVDGLITNFHLPESTLLMLISAFIGRENVLNAYEEAVKEEYRFFSFGDACFLLPKEERP